MPEHNFLQQLRKEHTIQKKLAKQLIKTTDPSERDSLRKQLHSALYPHIIGEEASMFARLSGADDKEARDDALEGLEEHHVAKILLQEMMEMDTGTERFKAKIKVLDELNRHHIEEEEDDIFEHLEECCPTNELDDLYERYKQARQQA